MPHPLFTPEIREALRAGDAGAMREISENLHPAPPAEALPDASPPQDVWQILSHADIRTQAVIFEYLPVHEQLRLAEGAAGPHLARLVERMSHDDRANLIRRLRPRAAEALLRLVDEADRRDIAALAAYAEGTAGAIMTTDYAWVPEGLTVAEAFERLRLQAPDSETIYYVYVLGPRRELRGLATLRRLVLAPPAAPLRGFMERELVSVRAGDDQEEVARLIARYDLLAVPVVDGEGRLVGIVTHDDVLDVIQRAATEDAQRQAGVAPLAEDYLRAGLLTVWRKRVGWLAMLFVAELFTFSALASFEDAIERVVVLSLFVPLCISTGGNSGSQAATLITRSLALGQVEVGQWRAVLGRGLLMGVVVGLSLGAI